MSPVTDTAAATIETEAIAERKSRPWRVWLVVVLGVGLGVAFMLWNRPMTPSQFANFAQKLNSVSAPSGPFTVYDPNVDMTGINYAPEGSLLPSGPDLWSSTSDAHSWVALRAWQTMVAVGHDAIACREVLAWLTSSGRDLGLSAQAGMETQSRCMAQFAYVRATAGSVSAGWVGRGIQYSVGRPSLGTGSEFLSGLIPGQVMVRVTALARVSNP